MPRLTGLQAAREIKAHMPETQVLMLSMHDDERYVFEALKAGASGYVLKREVDQALVDAIRAVHRGESFLTNAVERSLIREWMSDDRAGPDEPLTPREQEVLKLIAEAHTNKQIAEILHLRREDRRVAPREHPAQARDARPRRARPLRDPPRADGGLDLGAGADPRPLRPRHARPVCRGRRRGRLDRRQQRQRACPADLGVRRLDPPARRAGAGVPRSATRTASRSRWPSTAAGRSS